MRTSEHISNIAKALAAAQGEMKNPECNEEVKVYAKKEAGGGLLYTYKYATLPKCYDAARAPFQKNGLSHSSGIVFNERGGAELVVRITHESGEWYESSVPLSAGGDAKAKAGEVTFWKRYLFNGLAGIAGDDDQQDANGDRGPLPPEQPQGKQQQQQRPPQQNKPQNKPAQKPANAAPQNTGKPAPEKDKPTPFDQADAPSLKGEAPKAPARGRGLIVKEIMQAAKAAGLGTAPGSDVMTELEGMADEMFKVALEKTTDAQLEELLTRLNGMKKG